MPKNIEERQAQRRRNAVWSAVMSTFYRILGALAALWLRTGVSPSGIVSKALLILVVLDLGSILPIWISLKARLKEIEGGEEDAAAQY